MLKLIEFVHLGWGYKVPLQKRKQTNFISAQHTLISYIYIYKPIHHWCHKNNLECCFGRVHLWLNAVISYVCQNVASLWRQNTWKHDGLLVRWKSLSANGSSGKRAVSGKAFCMGKKRACEPKVTWSSGEIWHGNQITTVQVKTAVLWFLSQPMTSNTAKKTKLNQKDLNVHRYVFYAKKPN